MNKGNQNAAKPESDRASSFIHMRVLRSIKSKFVKAAHPGKLTPWLIQAGEEKIKREVK